MIRIAADSTIYTDYSSPFRRMDTQVFIEFVASRLIVDFDLENAETVLPWRYQRREYLLESNVLESGFLMTALKERVATGRPDVGLARGVVGSLSK